MGLREDSLCFAINFSFGSIYRSTIYHACFFQDIKHIFSEKSQYPPLIEPLKFVESILDIQDLWSKSGCKNAPLVEGF